MGFQYAWDPRRCTGVPAYLSLRQHHSDEHADRTTRSASDGPSDLLTSSPNQGGARDGNEGASVGTRRQFMTHRSQDPWDGIVREAPASQTSTCSTPVHPSQGSCPRTGEGRTEERCTPLTPYLTITKVGLHGHHSFSTSRSRAGPIPNHFSWQDLLDVSHPVQRMNLPPSFSPPGTSTTRVRSFTFGREVGERVG